MSTLDRQAAEADSPIGRFLHILLLQRLLVPEEVARLLRLGLGTDPIVALVEHGMIAPPALRAILWKIMGGAPEESAAAMPRWDDVAAALARIPRSAFDAHPVPDATPDESLATLLGGDGLPASDATTRVEDPLPGLHPGVRLSALDPWRAVTRVTRKPRLANLTPLRTEAGRQVFSVDDTDLGRALELHQPLDTTPVSAIDITGRLLGQLFDPTLPTNYEMGFDPDDRPYMLLSPPPGEPLTEHLAGLGKGPETAKERRRLLGAMVRVAWALYHAHRAGMPHLNLSPETIWVDRHDRVMVTGWGSPFALANAWDPPDYPLWFDPKQFAEFADAPSADEVPEALEPYRSPEVRQNRMPGPAADLYALGICLAALTFGTPARVTGRRTPRLLPGAVPELVPIIRACTQWRPSKRYRNTKALAFELDRAFSGEAVEAGRSPLGRRIARAARRRPFLAMSSVLLAVFAIAAAGLFGLTQYQASQRSAARLAANRSGLLEEAEADIGAARAIGTELAIQITAQDAALTALAAAHAARTRPGTWAAPIVGDESQESLEEPALIAWQLAARQARGLLSDLELITERVLRDRLERFPADAPAGELKRCEALRAQARELLTDQLLRQAEAELKLALFLETRALSSRTIQQARATSGLGDALSLALTGDDAADSALRRSLEQVHPAWRQAARHLARLSALIAAADRPFAERTQSIVNLFNPNGQLRIGQIPPGLKATLREVDTAGSAFGLRNPRPVSTGQRLPLPTGEYLLTLGDGTREVHHDVLLGRRERYVWTPEWPGEWPPGDWCYIPPSRFRAGGTVPSVGPYRTERVEAGYFISKYEISLGQYTAFLKAIKSRSPGELARVIPRFQTGRQGIENLVQPATLAPFSKHYHTTMPVAGINYEMGAAFTQELTKQYPKWTWRLPTEAEWELAARGAAGRIYPWGDRWLSGRANTSEHKTTAGNSDVPWVRGLELPGGQSIFGVRHMIGNVDEWTRSPDTVAGEGKYISRGGFGWQDSRSIESMRRYSTSATSLSSTRGLRIVCIPAE